MLQNDDGSISGVINKIESADMRFSYCAAYLIWLFCPPGVDQPINVEKFVQFIKHCQSPVDSAFGQVPEAEGHGKGLSHENSALFRFCKVGCVFPMVIVSILPHAVFRRNDHRKDAPHFMCDNPKKSKYILCSGFFTFIESN